RADLLEMRRQLRSLTGGAGPLGFAKIARMSTGLEALLIELHTKPAKITPSVVRTVAQAIDTLASLFDRAAKSQPETLTSAKILVVDDEVISRETICSALGKAGLDPVSLDDSLAAQHLLEKDHCIGRAVGQSVDLVVQGQLAFTFDSATRCVDRTGIEPPGTIGFRSGHAMS